jgi:hypothetical protein
MSKNLAHPETFPAIFDDVEFKWPFKKPQAIEYFWSQFRVILNGQEPLFRESESTLKLFEMTLSNS